MRSSLVLIRVLSYSCFFISFLFLNLVVELEKKQNHNSPHQGGKRLTALYTLLESAESRKLFYATNPTSGVIDTIIVRKVEFGDFQGHGRGGAAMTTTTEEEAYANSRESMRVLKSSNFFCCKLHEVFQTVDARIGHGRRWGEVLAQWLCSKWLRSWELYLVIG